MILSQNSGRQLRGPLAGWFIVAGLVAVLPFLAGSGASSLLFYQEAIITFLAVLGLNLQFGYGGELAIAQPVIAGVAAYTSGAIAVSLGWSALVTLPICIVVALLAAFVVNLVGFRAKGWYLAATTFFAVLVFPNLVDTFATWTGGDGGLIGIPPLPGMNDGVGGTSLRQYEVLAAIAMVLFLASITLIESRWGDFVLALRDCPNGLSSCGMSPNKIRLSLIVVSTIPVAFSGWAMAHFTGVLVSSDFGLSQLLLLVGAVMIGGRGTLWGPVVGTAIFEFITYFVGPYSSVNQLILGISLLVIGGLFPIGIVGAVTLLLQRVHLRDRLRRTSRPAQDRSFLASDVTDANSLLSVGSVSESSDVLHAEGVGRRFGGNTALDDVHIKLLPAQVVGLVGPNGSGKTTLLNVLTGYITADAGTITLDGRELKSSTPASVALAGVRRSFQTPQLVHDLSLSENLALGVTGGDSQHIVSGVVRGPSYKRRTKEIEQRIGAIASLLGFTEQELGTPADELSLGHQRIAEVGRAIMGNPRVICLDEPAAGLDDADLDRLAEALAQASSCGVAVLLIEHNLTFVRKVSDVMVGLEAGRVVSIDELRREGGFDVSDVLVTEVISGQELDRKAYGVPNESDVGGNTPSLGRKAVDIAHGTSERSGPQIFHTDRVSTTIGVHGLSAWYGKARALNNLSFSVGNGEIVGILGPNGAGKTTLLQSIGGLQKRVEGRIEFEGQDMTHWPAVRRTLRGVSLVREGSLVFSDLTVSEHLALSKRLCEQRGQQWQDEDVLFEWLPVLRKLRETKAGALSGGQKQLLAVASAAMARPRCLLLDEPSAGLAESTLESVFEHIRRVADSGMTLIIAEQSPRYLEGLVDRFLWLDLGVFASPEDRQSDPDFSTAPIAGPR